MSNDGSGPGSSTYSSEFRNLFGGDSHGEGEKSPGEDSATLNVVPPASLLSQEPINVFEEQNLSQNNVTPSILLEQLAYVDNFMPSLEQDFANLDSWILQDSGGVMQNQAQSGNTAGSLGFDERLAAELSAFADDSFIFPDEDKRHANSGTSVSGGDGNAGVNSGDNDGAGADNYDKDRNDDSNNDSNTGRRNTHFLTQRRNTFLTSQYDHSKSRFSSKSRNNKRDRTDNDPSQGGDPSDSVGASPLQDHGSFTNVDIVSGARMNNGRSAGQPLGHSPNVPSPLSNMLASQIMQPYSVTASPVTRTASGPPDSVSGNSATVEQFPMAGQGQGRPQIQMPDYSSIPTSTLVALLPRVTVPSGAHRTLTENGFTQDQIDAIAAIIAHHEQEKLKQSSGELTSVEPNSLNVPDSDASRNAGFFLDILSRGSQSPPEGRDTEFADSVLQLDTHTQDSRREEPVRSGSPQVNPHAKEGSEEAQGEKSAVVESSTEEEVGAQSSKRSRSSEDEATFASQQLKRRSALITTRSPSPSPASVLAATASTLVQKSHHKRKVKEKELEASVAELSELAVSLQQKVHTLEMENKLLKNLVVSSGELEGIEKAESIRKQLLEKINGSGKKANNVAKALE